MSTQARSSYRTKFKKQGTVIGGVVGIDGAGLSVEEIDTTALNGDEGDSDEGNFMTSIPGDVDPGDWTLDLIFDPEDAGQADALLAEVNLPNPYDRIKLYSVLFSSGTEFGSKGWLKSFKPGAKKGDKLTAQAVIRCTGKPDWI